MLLKNYSLVKITYLLITFKKITPFPKNADSNGRNEQNPHTTQKEKDNFRKGYLVSVKKLKKKKKNNFMSTFYRWGSRLQSHYEETDYFLPFSSQEFLVLWLIHHRRMKGWVDLEASHFVVFKNKIKPNLSLIGVLRGFIGSFWGKTYVRL